MPRVNAALTAKRAEKAALKKVQTVTVTLTLEASEGVLQRLAALMMLQDPNRPELQIEDQGPLPFDEGGAEAGTREGLHPTETQREKEDLAAPPLDLNYAMIQANIVKYFEPYEKKYGRDMLELLIVKHGGTRVSNVSEDKLMDLLAEIEAACE
jgi:hypothetical protein